MVLLYQYKYNEVHIYTNKKNLLILFHHLYKIWSFRKLSYIQLCINNDYIKIYTYYETNYVCIGCLFNNLKDKDTIIISSPNNIISHSRHINLPNKNNIPIITELNPALKWYTINSLQ